MLLFLKHFFICDLGVTSIEYALLASLIALAIISAVTVLGGGGAKLYSSLVTNYPK